MDIKRATNTINKFYNDEMLRVFESNVVIVKELLLDGYDELSSMVDVSYSRANLSDHREKFEDSLDKFNYIEQSDSRVSFVLPSMETFDFNNQELLLQVLEGTIGTYVEISADDLSKLDIVPNTVPINPEAEVPEQVYLLEYTDAVKAQEREILKKNLVKFPFSESPPQADKVFGKAKDYVDSNINKWIKLALSRATREVSQKYRRI